MPAAVQVCPELGPPLKSLHLRVFDRETNTPGDHELLVPVQWVKRWDAGARAELLAARLPTGFEDILALTVGELLDSAGYIASSGELLLSADRQFGSGHSHALLLPERVAVTSVVNHVSRNNARLKVSDGVGLSVDAPLGLRAQRHSARVQVARSTSWQSVSPVVGIPAEHV